MRSAVALFFFVACAVAPLPARAHSLSFGVMRVLETDRGARVVLRAGGREGRAPALRLEVRGSCTLARPYEPALDGGLLLVDATLACPRGIDGAELALEGLDESLSIAVRVERIDGSEQGGLLDEAAPSFVVRPAPSHLDVLGRYLRLGVEHILSGLDHLLFVLALLLVVFDPRARRDRPIRAALVTVTGFTLGHSVTLSLAALGAIALPTAPVELCIALSIVLLAAELAREGPRDGLTHRRPWLVASSFGLLHGLGFAGALVEHGLPPSRSLAALAGFNLGVELGQLAFVAVAIVALRVLSRVRAWPRASAYAIGVVASVWLAARFDAWIAAL